MDERWKNIPGFDGYQVSNLGRVRSFRYKNRRGVDRSGEVEPIILRPDLRGPKNGVKYFSVILRLGPDHPGDRRGVHRLVYEAFCGDIPEGMSIDHINRDSADNRLENLRLAYVHQNRRNKTKKKNASSQYTGVVWNKPAKKFQVALRVNGKKKYFGYFSDEKDAALAHDRAAREHLSIDEQQFVNFNFKT